MRLLIIGTLVASSGFAQAESRPNYGGTVTGSLLCAPQSTDPSQATNHADVTIAALVFDSLYRTDPLGEIRPHVAQQMPVVSADGKTVQIALRKGVLFHDGAPVTSRDVVFSLRRTLRSPAGWMLATVKTVDVDGHGIRLRLRRRTPELVTLLAAPQTAVTPGGRAPRGTAAIGSGPFSLVSIDRRQRVVTLRANDRHFAGRPYLDTIKLRWFLQDDQEAKEYEIGKLDFSFRGQVAFVGHRPKYSTRSTKSLATLLVYVGFGNKRPQVTANVAFRKAVSLAVDRQALRGVGSGEEIQIVVDPVAVALGGTAPAPKSRQVALAEARAVLLNAAATSPPLLAAASGRSTLVLDVVVNRSRPDDREVAEKVLAALASLGLRGKIYALMPLEFARRRALGDADLFVDQLTLPAMQPAMQYAAVMAQADAAQVGKQLSSREPEVWSLQSWFRREVPLIPLFHRAVRTHYRSKIGGVSFRANTQLDYADFFDFGRPIK